jgi:mRNA-degrading endonuclease RelE of RelBE toxin-antitoxin system
MDKITKLLRKISAKDAKAIASVLESILDNKSSNLDIMKLKGSVTIFRVRIGTYRVIYKKSGDEIKILEISKRNDNTYRNY